MVLECFNCKSKVKAELKGKYGVTDPYEPILGEVYKLLECPGCHKPFLTMQSVVPDLAMIPGIQDHLSTAKQLYPTDDFFVNPNIPKELADALTQSILCFQAEAYTACAVMCRRTIEGFCKFNGGNERNLYESLRKLKDDKKINDDLFTWADQLRLSGNEAAHDTTINFSDKDGRDLLEFTMAILDFKYGYQAKFESFILRNSKKLPNVKAKNNE